MKQSCGKSTARSPIIFCSYWNMAAGIRHGSDIRKQRLEIMLSRSSVTITQIGWQRRSFPLKAEGLSLDAVYESFVRQLAGADLEQAEGVQETLQGSVQRSEQKAKLQKQIEALQAKIRKEKQLNKQMEMNAELKKLRNLLTKMVR
mgnify:CR=1 FL=1